MGKGESWQLIPTWKYDNYQDGTLQFIYNIMFDVHRNGPCNTVIHELCYKGTILNSNYKKMTISYNSFVKFHGEKNWEPQHERYMYI